MFCNANDFQAATHNAKPSVYVYHDTTQTVVTAATLSFNNEGYDRWGMHDTSTNNSRITIQVPGIYLLSASIAANSDAGGYVFYSISFVVNGATNLVIATSPLAAVPAGIGAFAGLTTQWLLNRNDYVEVRTDYNRNDGGNATFQAATQSGSPGLPRNCSFWAAWHSRG